MSGADPLDAMFGAESEVVRDEAPVTEQAQEAAPEPQPEPKPTEAKDTPRDERGRFAPKADGEQPQEAAPQEDEKGFVPRKAILDERRKRQELEREVERLRAQFQQPQQPQQPQQQEAMPPEVQQNIELRNQFLNMHEYTAKARHGDDVVEEAKQWFHDLARQEPGWAAEIQNDPFPYEALVRNYRTQQQVAAIQSLMAQGFDPTNPVPWAEQVLRARQAQQQQAQPAPQQPSRPPPRSLASQPSSGGQDAVPTGPGQAFDSLFTR